MSEVFSLDDIELQNGEFVEEIEGDYYLNTFDYRGKKIKRRIKFSTKPGRCNSMTKVGPCHAWPAPGRTRCRFHGGRTPISIENKGFKTGKYSKYVPEKVWEHYEESSVQSETEAKDLLPDVDLLNAYTKYYLEESQHGLDVAAVWLEIGEIVREMKQHYGLGEYDRIAHLINRLDELTNPLLRASMAENGVLSMIETKLRVIDKDSMIKHRGEKTEGMFDAQIVLSLIFGFLQKMTDILILQEIPLDVRQQVLFQIAEYSESAEFKLNLQKLEME